MPPSTQQSELLSRRTQSPILPVVPSVYRSVQERPTLSLTASKGIYKIPSSKCVAARSARHQRCRLGAEGGGAQVT
jgi:hypothetical protein